MPHLVSSSSRVAGRRPSPRRLGVVACAVIAVLAATGAGGSALGATKPSKTGKPKSTKTAKPKPSKTAKPKPAAPPSFAAPRQLIASTPNVPTAVSGVGEAVTLRPGSGPGPALQLATPHGRVHTFQLGTTIAGYDNPSVAISDSGVLAATWDTSSTSGSTPDVVEMAVGTFAAPPTNAVVLSPVGVSVSGEQAFVTPVGTAIAIWNETDADGLATVRAAIVPPGGTPTPVTLDADESFVGAGLDAAGGLVVIEQDNGAFTQRTIAADGTVGPDLSFTAPPAMSSQVALGGGLEVVVDGAGDQLYSWRPDGSREKLYAVWQSAGGTFGPVQALGVSADDGGYGTQVAVNASGHAVAVLTPHGTGPLIVRFASRLGHFGRVERVGAAGRYADMPVVSIDGGDRTLLAWLDSPASARGTTKSRALVDEAHATVFGPSTTLPDGKGLGDRYLGDAPLVAADPSGASELVTYGASKGSSPVGEIAFLTG